MITISINVTDDQARADSSPRLNSSEQKRRSRIPSWRMRLPTLDEWERPEQEVRAFLSDAIRVYCVERAAAPVDLSTRALSVGLD